VIGPGAAWVLKEESVETARDWDITGMGARATLGTYRARHKKGDKPPSTTQPLGSSASLPRRGRTGPGKLFWGVSPRWWKASASMPSYDGLSLLAGR